MYNQRGFICRPSDSILPEDAGIALLVAKKAENLTPGNSSTAFALLAAALVSQQTEQSGVAGACEAHGTVCSSSWLLRMLLCKHCKHNVNP
jgi:hypothetical protein